MRVHGMVGKIGHHVLQLVVQELSLAQETIVLVCLAQEILAR